MGVPAHGDQPDDQTPTPAATRNPATSAGPRSWSRESLDHGRSQGLGGGGMENGLLSRYVQERRADGQTVSSPVSSSFLCRAALWGAGGPSGSGRVAGPAERGESGGRSHESLYGMRPRGLALRPWP
ncbi:hypothetical protein ACFQVD_06910 [Streptosporangium amethystogenes subsp. fukuiense]|uniref:Uncharacterized protein n=1 Tax=Streptosporangium amethystogenes subsp. fukuiense TaxID=698418 RepID=A0ABW2SV18_9ACTN